MIKKRLDSHIPSAHILQLVVACWQPVLSTVTSRFHLRVISRSVHTFIASHPRPGSPPKAFWKPFLCAPCSLNSFLVIRTSAGHYRDCQETPVLSNDPHEVDARPPRNIGYEKCEDLQIGRISRRGMSKAQMLLLTPSLEGQDKSHG